MARVDRSAPGASVPGVDAACRASLHVLEGFYAGLELPLAEGRLVVGRGAAADLVFAEATISRAHAVLSLAADGVSVRDLGSTNGTLVNGRRVRQAHLADGDEVRLGRLRLRISLQPAAKVPQPAPEALQE